MLRIRSFLMNKETGEGGVPGGQTGTKENSSTPGEKGKEGQGTGAQDDKKDGGEGDKLDVSTLPASAQALIKSLREENAKHRTKSNNLETRLQNLEKGLKGLSGEGDNTPPEKQLEELTTHLSSSQMENALLSLALQNGIPTDGYKYFKFLMNEAVESLEEGQELSEDQIKEVIEASKKSIGGEKGKANSSVGGGGKAPAEGGEITGEQWKKMGITAKSTLYHEKPEVYAQLKAKYGL